MKTIRVSGLNASPSTLNSWMESPEIVRLEKLEGWKPKWRSGPWFGTCFHRINEMGRPGEWEAQAEKLWKLEKKSVRAKCGLTENFKKAELECAVAGLMCRLYYEYHAGGRDWKVIKQEELVQMDYPVEIDGVRYLIPLKGYIDGIYRMGKGRGNDWVFDSKTRASVKKEQSEVLLDYDLQMQFYRWVLPRVGYEFKGKHVKRKVSGIIYDQIRKPYMRNYSLDEATLKKIEQRVRAEMSSYFVRFQHMISEKRSQEWEEKQFKGLMRHFTLWLLGFFENTNGRMKRLENPFRNPYHHMGKLVSMYGPTDFMPIVKGKSPRTFQKSGRVPISFERVD